MDGNLTLKTLYVPGPDDRLFLRIADAIGPDSDLSSTNDRTSSDDVMKKAAVSEVLVLGPGAESASLLSCGERHIKFVQFTSCHQSPEITASLQADGKLVVNAAPTIAPFVAEQTMELIGEAIKLSGGKASLNNRVIGVIGLGNVGIEVARRVQRAGGRIVYHDIRTVQQGFAAQVGARRQSLDRLLLDSDIVTIHVSDTPHTPALIGEREFKLIKRGSILVNNSMANAIDETAMVRALESGKLSAAGLGVVQTLPDSRQNPLLNNPMVITELQKATEKDATSDAIAALVANNIKRFKDGSTPTGLIEIIEFPNVGDPAFWSSHLAPRQTS